MQTEILLLAGVAIILMVQIGRTMFKEEKTNWKDISAILVLFLAIIVVISHIVFNFPADGPIEQIAEEVIEAETGIDIEAMNK
jgi:hypothetical protein